MDNFIKKHLQDIATAIDEIESFFDDQPKLFENFCKDLRLRRAIERNIEIIGEAMNRILKNVSDNSDHQFPKDSRCPKLHYTWL
nr:HepT-like ribonuclease domain-containing protein [Parabacteroides distasonis]